MDPCLGCTTYVPGFAITWTQSEKNGIFYGKYLGMIGRLISTALAYIKRQLKTISDIFLGSR